MIEMATSSVRARSSRRGRGRLAGLSLLTVALVCGLAVAPFQRDAVAETREEAVAKRDESQAKVDSLQDEVEGIDAELAALFKAMEQTKLDVANTQIELADAEEEQAAAERYLESIQVQLDVAEAELAELASEVDDSKDKEVTLTQAVGGMARDLYRGDTVSTLDVVLSSEGTADIASKAAAATAMGRVQSRALDEVRASLVIQENQKQKQAAVTERIATLEQEAEEAFAAAEAARQSVADTLSELESLQSDQKAAEAKWNAQKAEAEKQIKAYDAAAEEAIKRIQEIDKQNEEEQFVVSQSTSSGSSSAAQPASGALFANPFRFDAPVTSYFGYRIHPIFGTRRLHTGTDFGAGCGTAQYATRAGVVVGTGYDSGLGNYVTINHGLINGQSMVTEHGHLESIAVSTGQSVNTGTIVGYTGTTGNSTGCHLHLNLLINGSYTSILDYM